MATTQTIAVLVPGITGSKLIRYNPLLPVWPDQVAASRADAARLLSQDGITAGEPILQMPDPQTKQIQQIRYYDSKGKPKADVDMGHDHGAGDPHIHDWRYPSPEAPNPIRQPGRPPVPGDPWFSQ